jgi:hypothetical protein
MNPIDQTTFWLDKNNQILNVSSSWDDFARQNAGESVLSEKVCGRPLREFINGDATRMWVDTLLVLARLQNKAIERPYRCDSPSERRYMQMSVIPHEDGVLEVKHSLLQTEPRRNPVHFRGILRGRVASHRRCSICGRVYHNNHWVEPEVLDTLSDQNTTLVVAYTVCVDCREGLPHLPKRPS